MTVRRLWIVLGLLVVGMPLVAGGYAQLQDIQADSPAVTLTPEIVPVSIEADQRPITASGTLEADQVVDLSFLVSGQIADVSVAEGDTVTAGQPLIRLENRQQYLAFDQANLSYGLALLQYQDVQSVDEDSIRVAEANVASARAAYSDVAGAVSPEDLAAAELQYQQALEAWEGAKQARSVANPGVLGDEGIALLDAAIGEASFNTEIARLRLEDLKTANSGELGAASAGINQAEAALEQVQAGPDQYQLEQAQNTVNQAVVSLNQAELNYNRTLLTAPFAGVITSVPVETGQRITAGATVLQLVDPAPLTLSAEINEADLAQIYEGMLAQVHLDALPGEIFDGVVTTIAPKSHDSGGITVYDIDIQLNSEDLRLRPGMSADADLRTAN